MLNLFILLASPAASAMAPASHATDARPYQSFDLEVPYVPSIARIDGENRLVYELHATNFSRRTLAIGEIALIDAVTGARIADIDPATAIRRVGAEGDDMRRLAPGQRAIVYISVAWPDHDRTPLTHRITFDAELDGAATDRVTIQGGRITPAAPFTAALGAPLRGGPWTAVALPEHNAGHRRYAYAVGGRVHLPGRHAIDWMPAVGFIPASAGTDVGADGSRADVLAVSDGQIVAVKEPPPPGARPSVEDETGAMIVLRLPDGRYAHYQHLQPGIALAAGATVRRGDVIGRVGSSGHVTRPHLHFHVADGIAPLDSEGLPYRLNAGRIVGRYESHDAFEEGVAWRPMPARPIDGLPAPHSVILFGDGRVDDAGPSAR